MKTTAFRNKTLENLYRTTKPVTDLTPPITYKNMEWKTIGYIALGVSVAGIALYCIVRIAVSHGNNTQIEALKKIQLKPMEDDKSTEIATEDGTTGASPLPDQTVPETVETTTPKRKSKS